MRCVARFGNLEALNWLKTNMRDTGIEKILLTCWRHRQLTCWRYRQLTYWRYRQLTYWRYRYTKYYRISFLFLFLQYSFNKYTKVIRNIKHQSIMIYNGGDIFTICHKYLITISVSVKIVAKKTFVNCPNGLFDLQYKRKLQIYQIYE